MLRRLTTTFAVAGLLAVLSVTSAGAAKTQQSFEDLCQEILEALQSFYPVHATQMGIHEYDHRFTDFSSKSVSAMISKLNGFEKKLEQWSKADLSPYRKLNLKLIKSNVDIALLDLRHIAWHKKSPQLYVEEAVNGIYYLLLSEHATLQERRVPILARMKAVPELMATARRNLSKPPQVYVDMARADLGAAMRFYQEVAAELAHQFPQQADEIAQTAAAAREALNDFDHYLETAKVGDSTAFAIGKNNFDYLLSNLYFLPYKSDSLLKIGEAALQEALENYRNYQLYVEEYQQTGQDSVFVPVSFCRQDILDYHAWETAQMRLVSDLYGFVTVPEDIPRVEVLETPPFLRSIVSSGAYYPVGLLDSAGYGVFFVRPLPDTMDRLQLEAKFRYVHRRGFRSWVVHEAYPGHHLQMHLAARNPDPVRRWQQNSMMIEGWALYCEEAAYREGLYGGENPIEWLTFLEWLALRAARVVADIKLHTGQFTVDQCVDWMLHTMGYSGDIQRQFLQEEVRRYTFTPGVQMSYLAGMDEILRLRDAAMSRDGEMFDMRDFHDRLLAQGSLPPTLLWGILELEPVEE